MVKQDKLKPGSWGEGKVVAYQIAGIGGLETTNRKKRRRKRKKSKEKRKNSRKERGIQRR